MVKRGNLFGILNDPVGAIAGHGDRVSAMMSTVLTVIVLVIASLAINQHNTCIANGGTDKFKEDSLNKLVLVDIFAVCDLAAVAKAAVA
jgi:hypothetical protein